MPGEWEYSVRAGSTDLMGYIQANGAVTIIGKMMTHPKRRIFYSREQ